MCADRDRDACRAANARLLCARCSFKLESLLLPLHLLCLRVT